MSDATVALKQSTAPDRLLDNEQLLNDTGQSVYRQRTADTLTQTLLSQLRNVLGRLGNAIEPLTARLRVSIESAAVTITGVTTVAGVTTVTTVTTCATVTSCTNLAQIGGVAANAHEYNLSKIAWGEMRARITVT